MDCCFVSVTQRECHTRRTLRVAAQLVIRVEDHLLAVAFTDTSTHEQRLARLDTRNSPPPDPHQLDLFRAVEEFRLDAGVSGLRTGFHTAEPSQHGDLFAAAAVAGTLCAGRLRRLG